MRVSLSCSAKSAKSLTFRVASGRSSTRQQAAIQVSFCGRGRPRRCARAWSWATVESVKGLRTGRLEIASMPSPAMQPLSEGTCGDAGRPVRADGDRGPAWHPGPATGRRTARARRTCPDRVEAAHREAVLPLVLQGTGVALVTQAWPDLARSAGAMVLDLEPPQYLHIWPLSRRAPLTPGARAFLDCALRQPIGDALSREANRSWTTSRRRPLN